MRVDPADRRFPYTEDLNKYLIESIKTKVNGRETGLIIIDGIPGSGKTTLAVHIADTMEGSPISLELDHHPQITMGGQNFIEQAVLCQKEGKHCIIYDEAGDFNRRGSMTNFNRNMNIYFNKCRAFKLLMIIVLPYFNDLDSSIFKSRMVDTLVHCYNPKEKCSAFAVFDQDEINWLRFHADKWKYHPNVPYQRTNPTLHGWFWNLPEDRSAKLAILSTQQKLDSISKIDFNKVKRPVGRPKMNKTPPEATA